MIKMGEITSAAQDGTSLEELCHRTTKNDKNIMKSCWYWDKSTPWRVVYHLQIRRKL